MGRAGMEQGPQVALVRLAAPATILMGSSTFVTPLAASAQTRAGGPRAKTLLVRLVVPSVPMCMKVSLEIREIPYAIPFEERDNSWVLTNSRELDMTFVSP